MAKKKKKKRTLGSMSNSRAMWERKPLTQVVSNGKKKNDRKEAKGRLKRGEYDD